jgi:neurofibromin 1
MQDSNIPALVATESLAILLAEISTVAAPTVDLSNAWRSRWMSLVASTAFQSNPAIQPRAFTVMGCLAHEDVDDDLLYQVLVALRTSISRWMDENDSEMLIAIVTSLTKMMAKLPVASRYGMQLFWLAMSLVRLVPLPLFNCCALFLEAVLSNITTSGELEGGRMVNILLQGRLPLEDVALQLDEIYGIHFNLENFHFAICATLVKGLTDSVTKSTALKVLTTFLETTGANIPPEAKFPKDVSSLPYLGLLLSRAASQEDAKEILWVAGWIHADDQLTASSIFHMVDLNIIKDKELLLNCAISLIEFHHLEDNIQHSTLKWLTGVALKRSTVMLHLAGPVLRILDHLLMSCQNPATLEAAHTLLRTLTSDPKLGSGVDTSDMLEQVLDGIGFGGLWRSTTFRSMDDNDRQTTALTDRLIELIIA